MVLTFEGRFAALSITRYIQITKRQAGVIWLAKFSNEELGGLFESLGLLAREYTINRSYEDWEEFSSSCSIVWYKNRRTDSITGWENALSLNYPLREFVLRAHYVNGDKRFIRDGPFPNIPIITAYHPTQDVRIIVDGIHRSAILTLESIWHHQLNHDTFPPYVTIYELYGDAVNRVFPCDFLRVSAK